MNDSQVALHAGEDVNEHLSVEVADRKEGSHHHHWYKIGVHTKAEESVPNDSQQLQADNVHREEVREVWRRAGTPLPLLLGTKVEDEDAEREDKEVTADREGRDVDGSIGGV